MKRLFIIFTILITALILSSCSSSEETKKENENDVYVFDEVPADTSLNLNDPEVKYPDLNVTYYMVQIGAFTTRERAEEFAAMSRQKLQREIGVTYSTDVNLYVVQLTPLFTSRSEAETVRNNLWQMSDFNDAWILTVNK